MQDGVVQVVEVFHPSETDKEIIEGARFLHPAALISGIQPATGKLPPKPQLEEAFGSIGYDPDRTIVVSDHEGGGWAGRLAWTLDVIQHEKWLYLDGGYHAWRHAGFPVSQSPRISEATQPNLSINLNPVASYEFLLSSLESGDLTIWDVRSREEFEGARATAQRNGHIPGAVNIDWLELMDHTNQLRLKPNLKEFLAERGVRSDEHVVTHCQTHHRSGLSYMVGRLLGFKHIQAYDGSWSEWGNRPDTPIETGGK